VGGITAVHFGEGRKLEGLKIISLYLIRREESSNIEEYSTLW
jgi:hypothetical protein